MIRSIAVCIMIFLSVSVAAQRKKNANLVYLDKQGVLRYSAGGSEASFFGVNYTTPFAHAYRAQKAMGVDLEQAIRNDVYHFARLGFDAFRVHVWDTEISDTAGNLLENEHLRLFDFLLAELKKRNIKTIVTPIAFWGNGYPERDEPTPGFSRYFGRGKLTTNDTAIRAQENYMRQFFRHVNPYSKSRYEDDRNIIAVEINNEPSHSDPKQGVTDYINRLTAAVKSAGWTKPVFYNIAQGPYFSDAVAASNAVGFSFQWYPSGLVGNQTLKGNILPHVDTYRIPFRDTVPAFKNKALMVYEFDAADIAASCVYPAMARSFRGAGFQWATQFAYDPMAIADVNTEYQTHYLNLAYTPSKAISMLIAGEVFHKVPRRKNYDAYPADTLFDVFRVSYANELSEMNAPDKFYYSNTTATAPADEKQLKHIAGVGSSPVARYEGTGAYFLDKIADGVWRLEVMPDAIFIRDPFERASPQKKVTAIRWASNQMTIRLSELSEGFSIKGLNDRNNLDIRAAGRDFAVSPGTYLLTKNGATYQDNIDSVGSLGIREFVAPAASAGDIVIRHEPLTEVSGGQAFEVRAIISGIDTGTVSLQLTKLGGGLFRNIPMSRRGYEFYAIVPAELVTSGQLQYRIIAQQGRQQVAYPGGIKGDPFAWDNYRFETYTVNIAGFGSSLSLYDPSSDRTVHTLPNFRRGFQSSYVSGSNAGALLHRFSISGPRHDEIMGLQHFVGDKLNQRHSELDSFDRIIMRARTDNGKPVTIKVSLVDKHGMAYSSAVTLSNEMKDIALPLASLRADSSVLLPRPYPGFQPLYFRPSINNPVFSLPDIERLQIVAGPWTETDSNETYSFDIESVKLGNISLTK